MKNKATVEIHLQPGAQKNELLGFKDNVLWVKVTAPPVKGHANEALIAFMAQVLSVPKSDVDILRGHASRHKVLAVQNMTSDVLKTKLTEISPGRRLL